MPVPLIKLAIVTIRTFARPFNAVLTRRMRTNATERECSFFHKIGIKTFELEKRIDEAINASSGSTGITIVPADIEKISKNAFIGRGVEVFVELTMFYGLLFAIACHQLYKSKQESNTV